MLEDFLQLISSQKGSHCPYLPPPRAARIRESCLYGLPPVLQPGSACPHTAEAAQSLEWQHAAMPMLLKCLEPAVGSEEPHRRTQLFSLLLLKARKALWAGIHSGSSKLTLWRTQADGKGRESEE